MMSSLEYVSFVCGFPSADKNTAALVSSVCELMQQALGDIKVTAIRMDSRQFERTRNSKKPTTTTREGPARLSTEWHQEWLDGSIFERLVIYDDSKSPGTRMDFNFVLDYDLRPVDRGIQVGSHLVASLCLSSLSDEQAETLSNASVQFAQLAVDLARAHSVLVDVGDIPETARGTIYLSRWPAYARFQRQVSRLVWVRAGEQRRNMARGVFWGNLLTTPMLAKLGGADGLIAEYRKLEDPRDHDLCTVLSDGSVWLTLSHSLKDVCHQSPGMTPNLLERAAWLWERLAQARLICGMQV